MKTPELPPDHSDLLPPTPIPEPSNPEGQPDIYSLDFAVRALEAAIDRKDRKKATTTVPDN